MPQLPEFKDPTLEAVDAALLRDNPLQDRDYSGFSELGHPCQRRLYLKRRKAKPDHMDAQGIRNVTCGYHGEELMAARLKAVPGITLYTEDPKTGRQWAVQAFGGHARGHLDGIIKGLIQAPKTWHVWEHKQVSEKRWRDLVRKKEKFGEKDALENWDEVYFNQAQAYMGLLDPKATRHYMTVSTPGGRNYTSVRTNFQKHAFDWLMEKTREVVESATPPPPVSNKADYYLCRWCHFSDFCHEQNETAAVNCRTCAHSTAKQDDDRGTWWCELHDKRLSKKRQRDGCSKHLFIPDLIPWATVTDMDRDANTITYKTERGTAFVNAEKNDWLPKVKHFTSKDLQHIQASNIDNNDLMLESFAQFETASIEKIDRADPMPFDDPIPELK